MRLPHGGAGPTRNRGVAHATRPLVAFLDSDDEWLPGKLKLQRAFLERRPDVLFCFSDFRVCLPGGETRHNFIVQWHRDPRGWDEILGPGVAYSSAGELQAGQGDFRVHVGSLFLAEMEADYVATSTVLRPCFTRITPNAAPTACVRLNNSRTRIGGASVATS